MYGGFVYLKVFRRSSHCPVGAFTEEGAEALGLSEPRVSFILQDASVEQNRFQTHPGWLFLVPYAQNSLSIFFTCSVQQPS